GRGGSMEGGGGVDGYRRGRDATENEELRAILRHNRDEEQEHAAMVLEWIRRHDAGWERQLRDYLFRDGSIVAREGALEPANGGGKKVNGASIGSLRTKR